MEKNIQEVYLMLKDREINPSGSFDKAGRWWSKYDDFVENIRTPSRAFPYSQMSACRTKKYVKFINQKYQCLNKEMILENI